MSAESRPSDAGPAVEQHPITVLIVTYESADHIVDCLASVPPELAVVVVDNASTDATIERVVGARPSARILRNATNTGFAAAVNQGIAALAAPGDVLLLNPDAVLEAGAVDALRSAPEPDVALVSALVVDRAGESELYAAGRRPTATATAVHYFGLGRWLGRWSLYHPPPVDRRSHPDWVAGTCVLVRRAAFDAVGGFDERFFLYAEDIDLAIRLADRGWRCAVEPQARARHLGGASVANAPDWVDRHRIASLDAVVVRHSRRHQVLAVRGIRVVGFSVRAALFSVIDPPRGRRYRRDTRLALRLARGVAGEA